MTQIYVILSLGLFSFIFFIIYLYQKMGKAWSFYILFKDFKRKFAMTIGLSILFFCFYFGMVGLIFYLVHFLQVDLFLMAYRNPIRAIYAGLWLFVSFSFCIYFARMVIKYLYLTRGRDN